MLVEVGYYDPLDTDITGIHTAGEAFAKVIWDNLESRGNVETDWNWGPMRHHSRLGTSIYSVLRIMDAAKLGLVNLVNEFGPVSP